jgi:predicted lysophospholipase L1 biosynthesis ABC-type transport system permease subunit
LTRIRFTLIVLLGAVAFVASHCLCERRESSARARGNTERKEISIRMAIGASRMRLIRQLLTESVLLALIGGVLGMLLAIWGLNWLTSLIPNKIPAVNGNRLGQPHRLSLRWPSLS